MSSRHYLVGLPVGVEITETGQVILSVDTTEVSVAIRDEVPEEYTDEQNDTDVAAVDRAFERGEIQVTVMRFPSE